MFVWAKLIGNQSIAVQNTANVNRMQGCEFELPCAINRRSGLGKCDKPNKSLVVEFKFSEPPSRDIDFAGGERKCV